MFVKFSDASALTFSKPIYVEADLVRMVIRNNSGTKEATAIYQQDSEYCVLVSEDIEDVMKTINEGRTNAGNAQS